MKRIEDVPMKRTPLPRRSFLRALGAGAIGAPILARAEQAEAALTDALGTIRFDASAASSVARLRSEYRIAPGLTYLNHASIGTVPGAVLEAHKSYLELCESNPSLYVWGSVWREGMEDTRARAAGMLGCSADDLAMTHNTTEGFSILAHGLPLDRGDEVLFSSLNHPGASVAWRGLATRRGFTVRSFDFPLERVPRLTPEEVVEIHLEQVRPRTRALVVPHVDNMVGMRVPLRALADAARAAGVEFVLVDGAQSAGLVPVDLDDSGVDAYSMSPHKWFQAPKGTGLFYVAASLRARLPRMWHRTTGDRGGSARIYEDYSTRAWPAVVALGDALRFQQALGASEKTRRYRAMMELVRERCASDDRLSWRSPSAPELATAIMAVRRVDGAAPDIGSRLMDEAGIAVRAFGDPLNALRISPNLMNDDDELHRALDLIAE